MRPAAQSQSVVFLDVKSSFDLWNVLHDGSIAEVVVACPPSAEPHRRPHATERAHLPHHLHQSAAVLPSATLEREFRLWRRSRGRWGRGNAWKPKCSMTTTAASVMAAIHLRLEPHLPHFKTSTESTRCINSDHE